MNSKVDAFIKNSKQWQAEIKKLRSLLLATKLEENFKWNLPCYSHNGSNVAILQPFKACLGMMFFKGMLLKDHKGLLVDNGPNSQAARRLEFRSVQEITKLAATIKAYVREAVALEDSGEKIIFKKRPQKVPEELKKMFAARPKFRKAFELLTPGRQRAYLLHFSSAKQESTRQARIEKCVARILAGKGMMDR